jgi:polyphosphate kinase
MRRLPTGTPSSTARSPFGARATLLNRELSWLDFNARVLELAEDDGIPLLERVKFCSIFSSNLDEFFMVRVAGLLDQATSGPCSRSPDGRTPSEALTAIRERVLELTELQAQIWQLQLRPALAAKGIGLGSIDDCSPEGLRVLHRRYQREIYPLLTPLGVGPSRPFPHISGLSLSFGVLTRNPDTGKEQFARVKVPEGLPRFVDADTGRFLMVEDVIGHNLHTLFPKLEIVEQVLFRVTRDADLELSDDADDLLEAVQAEVSRRRFGDVVRLEVAASASASMLDRLRTGLRLDGDAIYAVHGPLDLASAVQLAELDRPDLKDAPWRPITRARLRHALDDGDIFAEIRRGDILVQQPYESFSTSYEQFIRSAAADPAVQALKTTVYRTSDESPIVPSLVAAAESGKQSVCLVELKARFDERRNISWAHALEQAGVHVVFGVPGLKIHAKTTLVVRREGDHLRRYAHIGTGNYHSATARTYEDVGIFTADAEITADIADLFNFLTGLGQPPTFRKLLLAPVTLRPRLVELIRSIGAAAAAGERAEIRLKVNALTDPEIIAELDAAANAGASVDIIARSICTLKPENHRIRVRSVLGRFLEHSRILVFHAGNRSDYLIGSADLMPRNLDHRIEIMTPVESKPAQTELDTILDTLLADVRAWQLGSDGAWRRLEAGKRPAAAHTVMMRRAATREQRVWSRLS